MKLYALGAINQFGYLYDLETIHMTISQPRLDSISSFEMSVDELLAWAETEVKTRAELAFAGLGGFVAGSYCRWCVEGTENEGRESLNSILFSSCKPTKVNGGRTRNLAEHDLDNWTTFRDYCKQDVEVERQIRKKLEAFPISNVEQKLWELDQKINDEGVLIYKSLVINAIQADKASQDKLFEVAMCLTGLENPNIPAQLKGWLLKQGIEVESLAKKSVEALMDEVENPIVKRLLELRQAMSKISVKEYEAMERSICPDQRIRELLHFYGANRTGRWADRLVQIHNLPRNSLKNLQIATDLLKSGNYEALELLFESVPDVLSQLIRMAFILSLGHRFVVADFSAI